MANKKKIFDRLDNLNISNNYKNEIFNLIEDVEKDIKAGEPGNATECEIPEIIDKEIYYNDGSNEVVPIKHPDLSTQPSILPYKFMGQYVYEQLISKSKLNIQGGSVCMIINIDNVIAVKKPIFLEAWYIAINGELKQATIERNVDDEEYYFRSPLSKTEYLRVVYTSMPEETIGGYYYSDYSDYGEKELTLSDLTTSGRSNNHEYVDLGLPSGIKWARCNIGASTPIDNGRYFAWGETEGYIDEYSGKSFTPEDYKFEDGDIDDEKYIKYDSSDNLTTLEPSDDAAVVNMGGSWRMPNVADYRELIDNTTSVWTTVNGVDGRLFTSKTNGNTLFFPKAGYCSSGKINIYGICCWSSYVDYSRFTTAYNFYSNENLLDVTTLQRFYGCSVRGVIKN